MSIIYDALKKAEKTINLNQKATPDTTDKHHKFVYQVYILYAIVACVGLVIGNMIFGFLSHKKSSSLKQTEGIQAVKNDRVTQAKPVVAMPSETAPSLSIGIKNKPKVSLILNGVFFSENEGYALINNRIVKEGEEIEGLIVTRVNLNEVELAAKDGSIIKLFANQR